MAPDRLPPWRDVLLVAVGGGVGALARVGLAEVLPVSAGRVPWTTLLANVVGAFLLALLLTLLAERAVARPEVRLAVGTGAIGAFTTYSTLADELTQRLADAAVLLAPPGCGGTGDGPPPCQPARRAAPGSARRARSRVAAGLAAGHVLPSAAHLVVAGGFLVAYTTFSTAMHDCLCLWEDGARRAALGTLLLPLLLATGAAALGWWLAG